MHLLKRLRAIWRPATFQGWGKNRSYFEGWYFKMVSSDRTQAWAFIPGISHGSDSHAFIQVIDGINARSQYHIFHIDQFKPSAETFSIAIGDNIFSDHAITLNLPDISGHIDFSHVAKWKGSFLRPGIMGWYSFVPFMQCNHGLVSLDHNLNGTLKMQDKELSFSGGKGYIEKDWGSSFPKSWIWTQCNNYQENQISVMASVAHIPWITGSFIGFLALVWDGTNIKLFTTYTGATMQAAMRPDGVNLTFFDGESHLEIMATQAPGADLVSPIQGNMTGKVNESIGAKHHIIYRRASGTIIEDTGVCAGLEIAGNTDILLTA
ncbi:MAG: hypothetical protein HKN87_16970 [Saprospiraceae bacterium]|nr:hypothetical protein [Saprospiraceae bacterium]